ncbi:MAG: class I SAM-dependent methyltransferase [Planctomycetia bacterium]|nr:class I SAM-dependent methyltransferase [Planctomycetia bacterium]
MKLRSDAYDWDFESLLDYGNVTPTIQFRMIPENSTVMDVGCASGKMGNVLRERKNCTLWGMEYNPFSIEKAEATGAYQKIFRTDLNQFDSETYAQLDSMFDVILFGDVLEHLVEPLEVLEKFKRFLKPDGYFVISLPNVSHISIKIDLLNNEFTYTPTGLLDCTHLRFFTHKTFPSFFGNLGLKILEATGTVIPPKWKKFDRLPLSCRRLLLRDIHSWVFQYVLKVGISEDDVNVLEEHNRQKMAFTKNSLPSDIYFFNDRTHYYVNVYFPSLRKFFFEEVEI